METTKRLRVEQRNAAVPIEHKPPWIKTTLRLGQHYTQLRELVDTEGLHTVCQAATCPNIFECWDDREATFLVGGDVCTRRCDFCQIATGKPIGYDLSEPRRIAESVAKMGLQYATVTGVCRDDLADQGVQLYTDTIHRIHQLRPKVAVEILVADFAGKRSVLDRLFSARPEVFAHNIETTARLFKSIRPGFKYDLSLEVLSRAHAAGLVTKSNLMLGLGETDAEVLETLRELRAGGTDLLTITQYLRPSRYHHPVERWVPPEQFDEFAAAAREVGFIGVMSGPLVRSSYRAGRLYREAVEARTVTIERQPAKS